MRKFTYLLSLLMLFGIGVTHGQVTSLDQLSNDKCYTITAPRGYIGVSTNNSSIYGYAGTADKTTDNNKFVVYKAGDNQYYFWNVGQNKFVSALNTVAGNNGYGSLELVSFPESYFSINETNNANYPWYFRAPENGNNYFNMGGAKQCIVDSWSALDDGNQFTFEEAGDFDSGILSKLILVQNTKAVYIKCERGYMYSDAEHTKLIASGKNATPNSDDYKFVFYKGVDGNLYLYNVGANKFVEKRSGTEVGFYSGLTPITITATTGNATYYFDLKLSGNKVNHNNAGSILANWETADAGNRWTLEEAGSIDETLCKKAFAVQASYMYLNQENLLGGYSTETLADLQQAYDKVQQEVSDENISALSDAFEAMSSKEHLSVSNDKVFQIKNAHPTEKRGYLVLDDETPSYPNLGNSEYNDNTYAAYGKLTDSNVHSYWAVYTSTVTGKQYLYNITNGKFLKPESNTQGSAINFSEDAVPVSLTDNASYSLTKDIYCNGAEIALCMACGRANKNSKSVILSGTGADGGNPCYFIYQPDQTISPDILKIVEAEVFLAERNGATDIVGSISSENMAAGLALMTGETRTVANAEKVLAYPTIELKDGGYYRVINALPGFNKKKGLIWDGTNTVWNTVDNSTVNGVYQIIADNGKYVFKNANAEKYIQGVAGAMNPAMTANGHVELVALNGCIGQFNLKFGNGTMHANGHGGGANSNGTVINYSGNANSPSAWYLVPATDLEVALNTVGEASYATAYLPFAVSGAEGATVYTGSLDAAAGKLIMTEAEKGVAAKQAIVLVGEAGADKAIVKIGEGTGTSTNIEGTLTAKTIGDTESVLTLGRSSEGEIGFYNYTGTSIGANKAYINGTLLSGAQGISLVFAGGDVTGIEGINADKATDAPVYDIAGRKVAKTVKGGLYIQNGRKFIAK